jgi:hypothetical protein
MGHKYTKSVLYLPPREETKIMTATAFERHKKNLTITIDAETAAWARKQAAEKGMSVSRFVGELLHESMEHRVEYDRAMHYFLSRRPVRLREAGETLPTRDEIHDRSRLR